MNTESSASDALVEQFETALRDNRIPPCPAILARISEEMNQEEPDFRHLSTIIASDVALAAGLVRLANSPYFGARRRVSTVAEALMVLGLDTASQAVACIALNDAFPHMKAMERFWDASARIATLSGWLAKEHHWEGVRPQEAYTYGLFRDCGIAVLLQHFPGYQEVLRHANTECGRSFTDVENDVLPTNHVIVGAMMTQSWWLPENICLAVRHHHDLQASGKKGPFRYLVAISQLAEYLLQKNTGMSGTCEWSKLGQECLDQLGLDEAALAELEASAQPVLTERAA